MSNKESRFEQRRTMGGADILKSKGGNVRSDMAYVQIEASGNESDTLRQQNVYWREGYDKVHGDDTGIIMGIPKDEAKKNEKRYQTESDERLARPASAGLAKEFQEEGNTAGYDAMQRATDFLESEPEE